MSDFMRTLCKIAIPVTLQGMLQASFSIVDQIMIGQLGEAGIASPWDFRIVAFSYLPMAVSTVLSAWLRCKEHAAVSFWASFGAVAANIGLNYLLIFGKLGAPAMGVTGAAIATLVSQLLNLLLILIGFAVCLQKEVERPAHRGDLDTVGGRFMFIFRVQRRA